MIAGMVSAAGRRGLSHSVSQDYSITPAGFFHDACFVGTERWFSS